jgi:type VI secretion system Hcp family effector
LAYNIYLEIVDISDGASGEDSVGQFSKTEHEDEISVLALEWGIYVPADALSGQVTGNRRLGPLTITKHIDGASPLLAQSITNPVALECTFSFYRPGDIGGEGDPEPFYTMVLDGAKVTSVTIKSPNILEPENDIRPAYEHVSFSYNSITIDHEACSTSFIDNWTGE